MTQTARNRLILLALLLLGAACFLSGIRWGLPSRSVDPYLFSQAEAWDGARVAQLSPQSANQRLGADVDVNPLTHRDRPIVLNQTDAQRAEIIQRYRMFSFQPDEMITFSALAGMVPGRLRLDPRLYQYGGLWIYPVGVLLKAASVAGLVHLTSDRAFYLDHPEAFGRFYVLARLYSALWGTVGIWAVFWIAGRISGSLVAATGAAACFIVMPVVVNMAHEAKPHLPGAVLSLLAAAAAIRFVETGARRWWIGTSILCGAAAGMVLSASVAVLIIPTMLVLRDDPWQRRVRIIAGGIAIALVVYVATNPYVAINLVANRQVLRSNFSNSAAMYELGRAADGLVNTVGLVREGVSLTVAAVGVSSLLLLLSRSNQYRMLWLLVVPGGVLLLQMTLIGAGKPGEFGRFALFPDIVLGIAAAIGISTLFKRPGLRVATTFLLVALTAGPSWFYWYGFIQDSSQRPTRLAEADWLSMLHSAGARKLGVFAEPAPYSLPPVDLFGWTIILLPSGFDIARDPTDADVIVRPIDAPGPNGAVAGAFIRESLIGTADAFPTRISWAAKPFEVWVRPHLVERLSAPTPATAPLR